MESSGIVNIVFQLCLTGILGYAASSFITTQRKCEERILELERKLQKLENFKEFEDKQKKI